MVQFGAIHLIVPKNQEIALKYLCENYLHINYKPETTLNGNKNN